MLAIALLLAAMPMASPAEVGMDPAILAQMQAGLDRDRSHGLHAMVVLRRGRLVFERGWNGQGPDRPHDIRSATKSITSLLTGIAIERGHLRLDDPIQLHLTAPHDPAKAGITVAHLLTMRSGLACDDRDERSPGFEDTLYRKRDWVRFFLDLAVVEPPGSHARYCTGGVVALGAILAKAAGAPVPELADDWLFRPLGIGRADWQSFDGGRQTDTGGHLKLSARDLARIGQLVLQQGEWNGKQLVPAGWIAAATREQVKIDGGKPYGYLWWIAGIPYGDHVVRVVFAQGNGGQYVFVVPELALVAAFTGGNYNSPKMGLPMQILGNSILPACVELLPFLPPR